MLRFLSLGLRERKPYAAAAANPKCKPAIRRLPVRYTWCVVAAVLLALPGSSCIADRLITNDGAVMHGRILSETDSFITFEIDLNGDRVPVKVFRDRIKYIIREDQPTKPLPTAMPAAPAKAPDGPSFRMFPIVGELGVDVKAETLAGALAYGPHRPPDILILWFDSPGGSVEEIRRIMNLLADRKDLRTIAYVRRALSAAAVIATACPEIYMASNGTIGAAVPYQVGPDNTAKPIEEKFQSAIRAQMRAAAQMGDHSTLIIRGMLEPELVLSIIEKDGKPTVVEGNKGKPLKARGKILTLTANEAVACGFADGIVDNVESMYVLLGIDPSRGLLRARWNLMLTQMQMVRQKEALRQRQLQRKEYLQSIAPQLEKIDKQLAKIEADIRTANASKKMLERQYNLEVADIKARCDRTIRDARAAKVRRDISASYSAELIHKAKGKQADKLSSLRQRYQPKATKIQNELNRLNEEQKRLSAEKKKLFAASR